MSSPISSDVENTPFSARSSPPIGDREELDEINHNNNNNNNTNTIPGSSSPIFHASSSSAGGLGYSSPLGRNGIGAGASPSLRGLRNNAGIGISHSRLDNISSSLPFTSSSSLLSDLREEHASSYTITTPRRGDIRQSASFFGSTPTRREIQTNNINSEGNLLSISNLSSDNAANNGEPTRVIWGTNISLQECISSFRGFIQGFKKKYRFLHDNVEFDSEEGEELKYAQMLEKMHTLGTNNLLLDLIDLLSYPPTRKLYYQTRNYPQEVIPLMDQTVKDCMYDMLATTRINGGDGVHPEVLQAIDRQIYRVRPYNLQMHTGMRELNPSDIDKLVSVKGLVIRSTPILPDMQDAFFKCSVCGHTVIVQIDRGIISEPTVCPREQCASKDTMQIVHNRCKFMDRQVIKLQETPDIVPDGQTPHSVSLCVYDELVDYCSAGDRVEVTGIYQSVPVRVNPRQKTVKNLYKTYLDVVHIQKVDKRRLAIEPTSVLPSNDEMAINEQLEEQQLQHRQDLRKLSNNEIELVKELSKRSDIYELLARSIAPSVYSNDDVKKGILLQLFGGSNKTFDYEKSGAPRYRGDINILLCGDPSTSKSQIMQYVHKIAPRGVYTSGKGSSAVGLTAYVTRDPETRQLVLESGALVLSDGGVCCIDEFDKMSDSTRSVLHEVMEQQTVSIAKAGIITTLNARTSILASANPIGSKYNPDWPVTKNIDLPPTLLSRFDLVYLMLDKVDERNDRRLGRHLVSLYLTDTPETGSPEEILPIEQLTSYISYARQTHRPKISEGAKRELVKAYVDMRKLGEDDRATEKRITATTRQLESMIRLSEAHAKVHLRDVVTINDVKESVRLIQSAIKEYATDPRTGRIDMDLVQTGTSAAQRKMNEELTGEILSFIEQNKHQSSKGDSISFVELYRACSEKHSGIEKGQIDGALDILQAEGKITVEGDIGSNRRMIRVSNGSVA